MLVRSWHALHWRSSCRSNFFSVSRFVPLIWSTVKTIRGLFRAVLRLLGIAALAAYTGCADYPPTNVWDPSTPMTVEITSIVPSELHYLGQPVQINFRTILNGRERGRC